MLEAILPGVELMLLGMGTVFVFLSLLVLGMMFMSSVLGRLSPPEEPANTQQSDDITAIAAIAAAAWHNKNQS